MDDVDRSVLTALAANLRKELEPRGAVRRLLEDQDSLNAVLDDALHLAHHIERLARRGEL